MFGQRTDDFITMLQRLVALLRDLLLGIVILLTSIIIYFGGDPSKLNTLNWVKLICLAFLILVGPIVVFLAFQSVINFFHQFYDFTTSMMFHETPLHKGWFAWLTINIFGISKKRYVSYAKKEKMRDREFTQDHPRIGAFFRRFYKLIKYLGNAQRWNPYLTALLSIVLFIAVFWDVLKTYTPSGTK